jgi:hypothetical protein
MKLIDKLVPGLSFVLTEINCGYLHVGLPFTICGGSCLGFYALDRKTDGVLRLSDNADTLFELFNCSVTPAPGEVEALIQPFGVTLTEGGELALNVPVADHLRGFQAMTGAMLALAAKYGA